MAIEMGEQMADNEAVVVLDDGTEIGVHSGVLFREGDIALQVHDVEGVGCTAYLTPAQALTIVAALAEKAAAIVSRTANWR